MPMEKWQMNFTSNYESSEPESGFHQGAIRGVRPAKNLSPRQYSRSFLPQTSTLLFVCEEFPHRVQNR